MKGYVLKVVNISRTFSSKRLKMTKSTTRKLENVKINNTITDVPQKGEK